MTVNINFPLLLLILLMTLVVASGADLNVSINLPPYSLDLMPHRETVRALEAMGVEIYVIRDRIYINNYGYKDRIFEIEEEPRGAFTVRAGSVRSFRYREYYTIKYYHTYHDASHNNYVFRGRIYHHRL